MPAAPENKNTPVGVCEDCGAIVAEGGARCLKLFEEIIAKEFGDYRYGKIHRLTVDAYSLQHPDKYMRSGKSFAAHLTGVYVALQLKDPSGVNRAVQKWLGTNPKIVKPDALPKQKENITITFIHNAVDAGEHERRVREWARAVWSAWSEHHALAKHLTDEATKAFIKQ